MKPKHDFKKLDVERAELAVAVQSARDLVSSWMGSDFKEETEDFDFKVLNSTSMGLGASEVSKLDDGRTTKKVVSSTPERTHRAIDKLRNKVERKKTKVNNKPEVKEESDEEESKFKTTKRKRLSVIDEYKLKRGKRV